MMRGGGGGGWQCLEPEGSDWVLVGGCEVSGLCLEVVQQWSGGSQAVGLLKGPNILGAIGG